MQSKQIYEEEKNEQRQRNISSFAEIIHHSPISWGPNLFTTLNHKEGNFFTPYWVDKHAFIVPKRYKVLNLLGKFKLTLGMGSYGVVVSAHDTLTNSKVAIKKILQPMKYTPILKWTLWEIKLLNFMNQENIISILDLFPPIDIKAIESVYLVSELMSSDLM